jgi:hypothetical protein
MQTMNVPCDRCAEFRQRFEAAGRRVLGCEPDASAPGLCTLRYELPQTVAAAPAAPATLASAVSAPATAGPATAATAPSAPPQTTAPPRRKRR